MPSLEWVKTLRSAGRVELCFAACVLASLAAQWLAPGRIATVLLQLAAFGLGFFLAWRHGL